MSGAGRKWLTGCGIGCGILVLVLGAVGTCGYLGVRRMVDKAQDLDDGFAAVAERFGEPAQYAPPADGCLPPDRMETFLAVRDSMASLRARLSRQLAVLDGSRSQGVLARIKAAADLVPQVLGYVGARNRALLQAGMGAGEYQHIYCMAYYGLLQKDPADGPGFDLVNHEPASREKPEFHWSVAGGSDESADVRERRAHEVRRLLNRVQRQVLANQATALAAAAGAGEPQDDDWARRLDDEVRAMNDDPYRLPWQDGLPERCASCLQPYRARLEAAYDAMTSILDVGLTVHEEP